MKKILQKDGNTPVYIVLTAIIIAAVIIMGKAFGGEIQSSVKMSFQKQNSGFDYYTNNIATDAIE